MNRRIAFSSLVLLAILAPISLHPESRQGDEASCRTFVQGFYDWYLGPHVSDVLAHAWFDVAKLKPNLLSPQLRTLLRKEERTEARCGCIDHLDSDPFVNSQDPDPSYSVKAVHVSDGKCSAEVIGENGGSGLRPELLKTPSGWMFINFYYSFYSEDGKKKLFPDNDLVHMLEQ